MNSMNYFQGPLDLMLRSLVISQLGKYGHEDTITESKRKFMCHVDGSDPINADLRSAIFSNCVANGDETIFEQLIKVFVPLYYGL